MKFLTSVLVQFIVLSGTIAAQADEIPPACRTSSFVTRAYQAGVVQGKSLVQRAWLSVNDCDQLELFSDIVVNNVANFQITSTSAYTICRHSGMLDGVFQELDAVWMTCDGQCCEEGEIIGELSAELYCQLSILLQGLAEPDDFVRRPVYMCGFMFETCCDAKFVGTSLAYSGADMFGVVKECGVYTEGTFFDVWDGTREIQCTYVPPEAEP